MSLVRATAVFEAAMDRSTRLRSALRSITMTRSTIGLASVGIAAVAFLATCRYDPVAQEAIDELGDEAGEPGPNHRVGQPCLACHSTYEGATPAMAVGGTVFYADASGAVLPAPGVLVRMLDSDGVERKACTNEVGNFWVEQKDWADITYPLAVQAGSMKMTSIVGRDGSCAACHTLPNEESTNLLTGAGRASAGVVIVFPPDLYADCPLPGTESSATSATTGSASTSSTMASSTSSASTGSGDGGSNQGGADPTGAGGAGGAMAGSGGAMGTGGAGGGT
jgi:hypothetical protein